MKYMIPVARFRPNILMAIAGVALFTVCAICGTAAAAEPRLSDTAISDAVSDELLMDSAERQANVEVRTADGVVTLSGTVDNILAKDRARAIAETVRGVRAVVNEILVVPPVLRTDGAIREDVDRALLSDPATESFEIAAAVKDNVVTLSGSVDSRQERSLADKVAKGVKGVVDVKNDILIDYREKRPDSEIEADIREGLRWDTLVDDGLISVNVRDGVVYLSGIVGSASERGEAIIHAWVMGVKDVHASDLRVERWARDKDLRNDKYVVKFDNEIRDALKDAFLFDPRVMSFNITPEVSDGVVTLRGTVDNLQAKRAARRDARNTVGVVRVINRIKVRPAAPLAGQDVAKAVRAALARDAYVEPYEITVTVRNGVANLYGTVDSYFEKLQAEDVASRVAGVVLVNNDIKVEDNHTPYIYNPYVDKWDLNHFDWYDYRPGYTTRSDSEIETKIKDELSWSPFVDSKDVKVSVKDGVAKLTGTVDSWPEYTAAAENAYEGGAEWVDNDLTVRNWKR